MQIFNLKTLYSSEPKKKKCDYMYAIINLTCGKTCIAIYEECLSGAIFVAGEENHLEVVNYKFTLLGCGGTINIRTKKL